MSKYFDIAEIDSPENGDITDAYDVVQVTNAVAAGFEGADNDIKNTLGTAENTTIPDVVPTAYSTLHHKLKAKRWATGDEVTETPGNPVSGSGPSDDSGLAVDDGSGVSSQSARFHATAAKSSENIAVASADSALSSSNNSANSATASANSATASANSATASASSATASANSESNASGSATASANSASSASTSASNASTSASNAATSETNASNSATASANSASSAVTSASSASTSASNAATSASNASTSASNASTSASNAAASALVAQGQNTISAGSNITVNTTGSGPYNFEVVGDNSVKTLTATDTMLQVGGTSTNPTIDRRVSTGINVSRVSTGQSLPNATFVKIWWDTNYLDRLGEMSSGTFTPIHTGMYHFDVAAMYSVSGSHTISLSLYSNGVLYRYLNRGDSYNYGTWDGRSGSISLWLTEGQRVDIYTRFDGTGTCSLQPSVQYTWMTIQRLV